MHQDPCVCFIGDSFVNGTNDPHCLGWAGRLAAAARRKGHALTYYNLGVRRETSADIAARWQAEIGPRLPPTCHPHLVFSFGANDTAFDTGSRRIDEGETLEHAQTILRTARELGAVLMIGPPPVADKEHNERIARLSRQLGTVADGAGVRFLPVFDHLVQDETWMREVAASDGAHPGAEGYTQLAAIVGSWQHWWFR